MNAEYTTGPETLIFFFFSHLNDRNDINSIISYRLGCIDRKKMKIDSSESTQEKYINKSHLSRQNDYCFGNLSNDQDKELHLGITRISWPASCGIRKCLLTNLGTTEDHKCLGHSYFSRFKNINLKLTPISARRACSTLGAFPRISELLWFGSITFQ